MVRTFIPQLYRGYTPGPRNYVALLMAVGTNRKPHWTNDLHLRRIAMLFDLISPAVCNVFYLTLFMADLSPEGPGEGPDCHFPLHIDGCGPVSAWIRGVIHL